MADRQRHRGAHPSDGELFAPAVHATLRTATFELSWLLSRGYNPTGAIALVGNRHSLRTRQRIAIGRAACSDSELDKRCASRVASIDGQVAMLDGFNCVIALEAALSGGVLLCGRDGVVRDMASVHGSYRRVEETVAALEALAAVLSRARSVKVWLDRPVSNSGRLAELFRKHVGAVIETEVHVVNNPDRDLIEAADEGVLCSGDGVILNHAKRWFDLAAAAIDNQALDTWLVDLRDEPMK